jgi:YidC/Oxa1 family membrane protein insertase
MADEQGPNMEVRAFIAVVLSLVVMLGYQYFFAPTPPEPGSPAVQQESPLDNPPADQMPAAEMPTEETTPAQTGETSTPAAAPATEKQEPVPSEAIGAERQQTVTVETARYRATLDNRGARITSLILTDYRSDFDGPLELVPLLEGAEPGLLALASPEDPEVAAQANDALYRMTIDGVEPGATYRADGIVEIRWQWSDGNGWSIDKRLALNPDGYINGVSVRADSPSTTPLFITLGPGLERNADNSRAGIYLQRGAVYFDGSDVVHSKDDDLAEQPSIEPLDLVWGGIQSNYFVALFAPQRRTLTLLDAVPAPEEPEASEDAELAEEEVEGAPGTRSEFGVLLPPGTEVELPLYIGPKSYEVLAAAGFSLERAVDYGMFAIIARPVAVALEWLKEVTGNYGLAIIIATLGVRLVLFPLTQRSMMSMRKMQQLQPQMNAIRARYKGVKDLDKRQQMNTEVMQLYKDNGVSPLGGCLPMVLQMPVLFAFYAAISVSIASRQAPFILWIHDLSKMDPYYILPLLMGASMFAQQRMAPTGGDPMQQRIFRLMPVMFTFFFLTFPSGLVIYWLVNTALGIAQQAYVNHQLGAPDAKATKSPKKNETSNRGQKGGGAKRKKRGKR